jgi:hypothetical protein
MGTVEAGLAVFWVLRASQGQAGARLPGRARSVGRPGEEQAAAGGERGGGAGPRKGKGERSRLGLRAGVVRG